MLYSDWIVVKTSCPLLWSLELPSNQKFLVVFSQREFNLSIISGGVFDLAKTFFSPDVVKDSPYLLAHYRRLRNSYFSSSSIDLQERKSQFPLEDFLKEESTIPGRFSERYPFHSELLISFFFIFRWIKSRKLLSYSKNFMIWDLKY